MTTHQQCWRRVARDLARAGVALAVVMLVLGIAEPLISGRGVAQAAGVNAGTLQLLAPSATGAQPATL